MYYLPKNYPLILSKKLSAVIIEPREHAALEFVINNVTEFISREFKQNEWILQIFYGILNEKFVKNIAIKLLNKGFNIKLINLGVTNLTIDTYNLIFTDKFFWYNCLGKHILVFQTDSMFNLSTNYKIKDFIKYDFIGGPIEDEVGITSIVLKKNIYSKKNITVLNGGISLRLRKAMIQAIDINSNFPPKIFLPIWHNIFNSLRFTGNIFNKNIWQYLYSEDVFFCQTCKNLPPLDVSRKFGMASSQNKIINFNAMTIHKPWELYASINLKLTFGFVQKTYTKSEKNRINNFLEKTNHIEGLNTLIKLQKTKNEMYNTNLSNKGNNIIIYIYTFLIIIFLLIFILKLLKKYS